VDDLSVVPDCRMAGVLVRPFTLRINLGRGIAGVLVYGSITLLWPPIKPAERSMLIQLVKRRQAVVA